MKKNKERSENTHSLSYYINKADRKRMLKIFKAMGTRQSHYLKELLIENLEKEGFLREGHKPNDKLDWDDTYLDLRLALAESKTEDIKRAVSAEFKKRGGFN